MTSEIAMRATMIFSSWVAESSSLYYDLHHQVPMVIISRFCVSHFLHSFFVFNFTSAGFALEHKMQDYTYKLCSFFTQWTLTL